jgi:outer membrane protein TolC
MKTTRKQLEASLEDAETKKDILANALGNLLGAPETASVASLEKAAQSSICLTIEDALSITIMREADLEKLENQAKEITRLKSEIYDLWGVV